MNRRLSLEEVHSLAQTCLTSNGCNLENASAVADTITFAERDGCHAHGLFRMPGYVASLRSGKVNGKSKPKVIQIAPSIIKVDGDNGYAPLALQRGQGALIDRARVQGIAAMALVHTHHFAALWIEVEALAQEGIAALACTAYKPAVVPAGGSKPFFGTNPIAFGWPRPGKDPVVFDQATAAMARGEVMIAEREGRELPPGVGLDSEGNPTRDPGEVLKGAMLPFGGYKGSSISMMIELFVGPLIGERCSFEAEAADNNDGGPPRGGELLIALNPAAFGDAEGWADHGEAFFSALLTQEGIRLPGSRRHQRRLATTKDGIEVPEELYEKILQLSG
ncbi:MAG: Ldh family oxidoreductase [Kiloniellales bacterium]|nr:Ldh family oxidoreductase [Kiloniellales bacterium]